MVGGPAQYGTTALTLRCTKGDGKPGVSRCMPGAGLSLWRPGRPRLTGQPSSRTGENPPYGMRGGIEETSASFEARSGPRSYPTKVCPATGGFYIQASDGSVALPAAGYDSNSDWTPLLAGLSPAGMAARAFRT